MKNSTETTPDSEVTYFTPAYFNAKQFMWVGVNGEDACQDHGVVIPCPYPHGRHRAR